MTREEAIHIIEKDIQIDVRSCTNEEVHTFITALNMAIAALREQCVRDATKTSDWISAEERLPERGKKVLCYMNYLLSEETKSWGTCVTENTYHGVLVGSNPRKHVWEWQGDFVTHWMPLPATPKEEV